ncbi:hypothetical protein JEP48_18455 [Proteus mirabilis]|nr:hypothetical protein [Proteus mirabilis]
MSGIIIAVIFFVIGFFVSVVINIIVSGSEKEKIKNFITIYKEYDVKITDSSCWLSCDKGYIEVETKNYLSFIQRGGRYEK